MKSAVMERSDVAERQDDPTGDLAVAELRKLLADGDLRNFKGMLIAEAALLFRVKHKTVVRWIEDGKVPAEAHFRTPGGHHRLHEAYVHKMLAQSGMTSVQERNELIEAAKQGVIPADDPVMNRLTMPHRFR